MTSRTIIRDFLVHDVKVEVASNRILGPGVGSAILSMPLGLLLVPKANGQKKCSGDISIHIPIVSVSRRSAEMIKYACNNFWP